MALIQLLKCERGRAAPSGGGGGGGVESGMETVNGAGQSLMDEIPREEHKIRNSDGNRAEAQ
jgi:hypothetical protein